MGQVPGVLQRSCSLQASPVDREGAFEVGPHALEVAVRGGTGGMATILRRPGPSHRTYYDRVPLEKVANSGRVFPPAWIAKDGIDVTDDFILCVWPLIVDSFAPVEMEGGLQRFALLMVGTLT